MNWLEGMLVMLLIFSAGVLTIAFLVGLVLEFLPADDRKGDQ